MATPKLQKTPETPQAKPLLEEFSEERMVSFEYPDPSPF